MTHVLVVAERSIRNVVAKISVKEFLNVLCNNNEPTPLTYKFDVVDKKGQKDNRWWDRIEDDKRDFSKQKYHIHATFMCAAYNDWKNENISNEHWKNEYCNKIRCDECYKNYNCNPDNKELTGDESYIKEKFNKMRRVEMYLWFVEAFRLLDDEKLQCMVYDMEKGIKLKDIRENYNLWELLKKRIIDIRSFVKII